jgi:hypothetical protein
VAKNLAVSGNYNLPLKVTDATASSSYSTGCAILSGGLGVAEDIYSRYNIISESGYLKSGLGRWPTGSIHGEGITGNTIYDTLISFIPNNNDAMILSGSMVKNSGEGIIMVVNKVIRVDNNTIGIYYMSWNGTTAGTFIENIDDGGATTYDISISW